jgi:hypothetical protein
VQRTINGSNITPPRLVENGTGAGTLERKRHRLPPSATDVRFDGDEMAADADDGDAGHFWRTYMRPSIDPLTRSQDVDPPGR